MRYFTNVITYILFYIVVNGGFLPKWGAHIEDNWEQIA